MKRIALLALVAFALPAYAADTKNDLPCRYKAGAVKGSSPSPKVFTTNTNKNAHKGFKTSVGAVSWDHDDLGQSIPLINGKPITIAKQDQGSFGNGKVFDLGGKILLSYQVMRMEDTEADPSIMTLLVGPGGKVLEQHFVQGMDTGDYACNLVR